MLIFQREMHLFVPVKYFFSQASFINIFAIFRDSEVHGEYTGVFNMRHLTQDVWTRDELIPCQLQ